MRYFAFCVECDRFRAKTDTMVAGNTAFGGGLTGELGGGTAARARELARLHNAAYRETHRILIAAEFIAAADDWDQRTQRDPSRDAPQAPLQCKAMRVGHDLVGNPLHEFCVRPAHHGGPHDIMLTVGGICTICRFSTPSGSEVAMRASAALQRPVCSTCLGRVETGYDPERGGQDAALPPHDIPCPNCGASLNNPHADWCRGPRGRSA